MSNTVRIYAIHSLPMGKPWQDWIKLWWKWCYGDRLSTSPVLDLTGKLCGRKQTNEVWFLAGTFGGIAERRCIIPNHKSLFFPVLNDIVSFATDPHLKNEEQLSLYAKADLDNTRSLRVVVDGNELEDIWRYRIRTSPFDVVLPVAKPNGKYAISRAVSDGYWMFLHPLTKGCHTIHFGGEKLEFDKISLSEEGMGSPIFKVDVKYDLTIC